MSAVGTSPNYISKPSSRPPLPLPGFEHIDRYWDKTRGKYAAKIHPGELYVSNSGELVATVLGSCISACIRDPGMGIGGMNHFMLPLTNTDKVSATDVSSDSARYGNYAMEALINAIVRFGGAKERLEVKVFGGGKVMARMSDVGMKNINFVHEYLELEGFRILAEDTGGLHPRKVIYDPISGKVGIKKLKTMHNDTVAERETRYQSELTLAPVQGEVDLF